MNFIMLGKVGLKPDKILQMLREDRNSLAIPQKISNCVAPLFLSTRFVLLLKNSNEELLDEFLTTAICTSKNKSDVRNISSKRNNDYVTETSNKIVACPPSPSIMWNIKSGKLANKENYPVLNEFKIPVSNDQTINQLLCELIKLKSEKLTALRILILQNGMDSMYV